MSETVDRIDDVIAYIESPEYLRMAASLQGESAHSLLSGSRTQAWKHANVPDAPREPNQVRPGDTVRILINRPWSAPLVPGQLVEVISEVRDDDDGLGQYIRARDEENWEWWIPATAFERVEPTANDGLADWERSVTALYEALPEPEPEPEPVVESTFDFDACRFGIQWSNQEEQCVCPGCVLRRNPPPAPEPVPVQLSTRDSWTEYAAALRYRIPIRTRGNLRGVRAPESHACGYLSDKSQAAALLWSVDQGKIDYVVYSYHTPIAWHVTGDNYSEWIFPKVEYSPTSSKHQTKIKAALKDIECAGGDPVRFLREG